MTELIYENLLAICFLSQKLNAIPIYVRNSNEYFY